MENKKVLKTIKKEFSLSASDVFLFKHELGELEANLGRVLDTDEISGILVNIGVGGSRESVKNFIENEIKYAEKFADQLREIGLIEDAKIYEKEANSLKGGQLLGIRREREGD